MRKLNCVRELHQQSVCACVCVYNISIYIFIYVYKYDFFFFYLSLNVINLKSDMCSTSGEWPVLECSLLLQQSSFALL